MLRKLFSQTAIYGVSLMLSKFLNYLLTPYLTNILESSVYGEMSLYYGIIPFANALLTMGLTTGYFRFAAKCASEEQKKQLFSTIWLAVSAFSVLFFAIFSTIPVSTLGYSTAQWHMVVVGAIIMLDNIKDMPLASLRQQGRAKRFLVVNVVGVLVNIVLCVLFYTFIPGARHEQGWVLVANFGASLVSLLILLPSALKMYVCDFSKTVLRTLLKYSIPLMIAGIMGVASDLIDRQMLKWILPSDIAKANVGIYAAVSKIAALMIIFRQMYTIGAEPYFLQEFSRDDFRIQSAAALKYFVIAGLGIFVGCMLFVEPLGYIVGANFREGMTVVPLLLMAYLFSGILINLSFWYKQADMTRVALYVTLTGLVTTVALNLVLIPRFGYQGAAWTRLIATVAMVVLSYVLGQIYYKIPYDMKRILLYFVVALAIYVLSLYTATLMKSVQYSANILLILSYALLAYNLEWKKSKS